MSHSNLNIFPFESVDLTQLFNSSPAPVSDSLAISLQACPSNHSCDALTEVAEAHQIYIASNKGKKITLQHCWEVLRLHQKWENNMDDLKQDNKGVTTQTKQKHSKTSIDICSDTNILPSSNVLAPPLGSAGDKFQPRPKGCRKAKLEQLESSTSAKSTVKDVQLHTATNEAKRFISELIAALHKKANAVNTALVSAQKINKDQIMLMDPSGMTRPQRAYIEEHQAQIFAARQANKVIVSLDCMNPLKQGLTTLSSLLTLYIN
ncbi:uncharacterized protein MELLADRAFT_109649 [Melampsora larici-populina 98AG31]|uniref:No apical meristem-associated C-terminal domain-containing protein n=1 Tax=Melampsora larici-populina (strain 98AG31 / pathotype 3-4-7) TaxID=747676 RepID=F4RX62_MELLP|nr:uncharacterized protein MELLADRAFT_109649 [Melampsora larici-populina 98AG31]EGG02910.1 hypothetical protein MELLADRAFT_109649 [Melampsora larici-populina 98AG31]